MLPAIRKYSAPRTMTTEMAMGAAMVLVQSITGRVMLPAITFC